MEKKPETKQIWENYYETLEMYENYYPESFVSRIFISKNPVKFIEDNYKGKKILDLGCGYGRHIPFLVSLGFDVSGLEVSRKHVDRLKKLFPHNNFILGETSNIKAENNSFDYILACNSIYYIEDIEAGLSTHMQECSRVLVNGGKMVFTMLGDKHSILRNSIQKDNGIVLITEDYLEFRNGIYIRPFYAHDNYEDIFSNFSIEHHGEIIEKVSGTCRHIHYFLAVNNN